MPPSRKLVFLAAFILAVIALTLNIHILLPVLTIDALPPPSVTISGAESTMQENAGYFGVFASLDANSENNNQGPCSAESHCIRPILQVKVQFRVYMCKNTVRSGARFYFLIYDGLSKHPAVELVNTTTDADFVFYLPSSSPWHKTECTDKSLADRLIVLDEADGVHLYSPRRNHSELEKAYPNRIVGHTVMWYFLFFKRSYVDRNKGRFRHYPHLKKQDVYPITYSIADSYIRDKFNEERHVLISCTLRAATNQPSRSRVLEWLNEYAISRAIPPANIVTAEVCVFMAHSSCCEVS
jgi:hypothetical protein